MSNSVEGMRRGKDRFDLVSKTWRPETGTLRFSEQLDLEKYRQRGRSDAGDRWGRWDAQAGAGTWVSAQTGLLSGSEMSASVTDPHRLRCRRGEETVMWLCRIN